MGVGESCTHTHTHTQFKKKSQNNNRHNNKDLKKWWWSHEGYVSTYLYAATMGGHGTGVVSCPASDAMTSPRGRQRRQVPSRGVSKEALDAVYIMCQGPRACRSFLRRCRRRLSPSVSAKPPSVCTAVHASIDSFISFGIVVCVVIERTFPCRPKQD